MDSNFNQQTTVPKSKAGKKNKIIKRQIFEPNIQKSVGWGWGGVKNLQHEYFS